MTLSGTLKGISPQEKQFLSSPENRTTEPGVFQHEGSYSLGNQVQNHTMLMKC